MRGGRIPVARWLALPSVTASVVAGGAAAAIACAGSASGGAAGATAARTLPADAELLRDPAFGTLRFAKGADLSRDLEAEAGFRADQRAGRHEAVARAFLEAYAAVLRLERPGEELALRSVETDALGMTHVSFAQAWRGLPIPGAELKVHLDRENHVVLLDGSYVPTPAGLDPTPAIDAARARQLAAAELAGARDDCGDCACELVVFADRGVAPRLAWRVRSAPERIQGFEITLDASNGALLRKLPTAIPGLATPSREAQ